MARSLPCFSFEESHGRVRALLDTPEDRRRFAAWLEGRRLDAGINKAEMARRAGVSKTTVTGATRGTARDVSSAMVARLGAAVGATLGESLAAAGMLPGGITPGALDEALRIAALPEAFAQIVRGTLRAAELAAASATDAATADIPANRADRDDRKESEGDNGG